MFNNSVLFRHNENEFVFDRESLVFCELDDETKNVFLRLDQYGELPENQVISDNLMVFANHGFFLDYEPAKNEKTVCMDYASLSFPPVHQCNLRCAYCFADGGNNFNGEEPEFTEQKIDEMLEFVYYKKFKDASQYRFDFVSGGEPLINFEIIRYFVEKVKKIDEDKDVKTSFFLVTNGTLLNDEILKFIDNNNIDLGISLDGDKALHDKQRTYAGGGGTYDDVVAAIQRIQLSDCSPRTKDIWALAVITKNTTSIKSVLEHHAALNIRRTQMKILRSDSIQPLGFHPEDVPALIDNYRELGQYLRYYIDQGDMRRLLMILNDNDSFGKIIRRLLLREKITYRCGAGKYKVSFDASGNYYPCDSFCAVDKFKMGNLSDHECKRVSEEFVDASIYDRSACRSCWINKLCGGDCYHNSFLKNGSIYEPDPVICELNQFYVKEAVDLLCYIHKKNPSNITRLVKNLMKRARMA